MTDSITITIPEINPETITAMGEAQAQEHETVVAALAAIRAKYAPLAKHNGYVKIAYSYHGDSNYSNEKERYYTDGSGKRVRALLVADGFSQTHSDQNCGGLCGKRLYLLQDGSWLELTRVGSWSAWQGAPKGWQCGVAVEDEPEYEYERDEEIKGGKIVTLTDAQVEEQYDFEQLIDTLSASLKTLAEKLPERLTRVRKTTALASALLAAIK